MVGMLVETLIHLHNKLNAMGFPILFSIIAIMIIVWRRHRNSKRDND